MNLKELLGVAELRQQMRDVRHNLRIADADLFRVMTSHQVLKQVLQRMRFRYHLGPRELRSKHGISDILRHYITQFVA